MPMKPEEFYAHALAAADAERRLPLSRVTGWEIFPFEQDGLRVVPLDPPELPEPSRHGEGGSDCGACTRPPAAVWSDRNWRLRALDEPTGVPLLLVLEPVAHFDLTDLPDELARELGLLIVHVSRAVEALPHVARAHVSRLGDGGAHLHVFIYARPAGFPQLRGTCLALWDDLLPGQPVDQVAADAAVVARALAVAYGGVVAET